MSSIYLDIYTYLKMPTGLITTQYVANQFRFGVLQAKGVSTLTVPSSAITTQLNAYDNLYVFDQLNSEVVQVVSTVAPGATSIPLVAPTQAAHAAGIACCSDGASGSLAQQIFTASQWLEDICHQSLYVSSYTEVLAMPTLRASIDNQGALWFRPRHFPIVDLTAIALRSTANDSTVYDPTQAIIDGERQLLCIPDLSLISSSGSQAQVYQRVPSRQSKAWLTITYDSGWSPLPWPVQRACSLLVNQCFIQLYNAIGSDQLQEGGRNVTFTLRGDPSGESLLFKEARNLLQPYTVEAN